MINMKHLFYVSIFTERNNSVWMGQTERRIMGIQYIILGIREKKNGDKKKNREPGCAYIEKMDLKKKERIKK